MYMRRDDPKSRVSMIPKQKRRFRSTNNKYLMPGTLSKLRFDRASLMKPITHHGKEAVNVLDSKEFAARAIPPIRGFSENHFLLTPKAPQFEDCRTDWSPDPVSMLSPVNLCKLNNLPRTPKTPQAKDLGSGSRLESLPIDLLVEILCYLHHDQLKAAFQVSKIVRKAALIARRFHFDYTTPDRSRQEPLRAMAPHPTGCWPFLSMVEGKGIRISTPIPPNAPRRGRRPSSHSKVTNLRPIAAVLFPETPFPSRCMVPSVLPRPHCKSMASNRVLF